MGDDRFPKVLVVAAAPIGPPKNTGITVASMFSEWPADRLAQVSLMPAVSSSAVQSLHYPESHVLFAARLRALIDRGEPRSAATQRPGLSGNITDPDRPSWQSAWADSLPLRSTKELDSFVKDFAPQAIYTPLGFNRVLSLVNRVARTQDVPVVPHFMDDWLPHTYIDRASSIPRRLLERRLRTTIASAPVGLAISEEMAGEYSALYGLQFHTMGNIVDVPVAPAPQPSTTDVLTLAYVGGLHLSRWEMLLDVARAVEQQGGRLRLSIHCPDRDQEQFGTYFTSLRNTAFEESLRADQVPAALNRHHVLVHVESNETTTRRFTRLSLSTKIPQYLAAARPILSYAPRELASVKHLERSGAALVVPAGDRVSLAGALDELDDRPRRAALGCHGHAFAREHHEMRSQAAFLRSILTDAARGPRGQTRT